MSSGQTWVAPTIFATGGSLILKLKAVRGLVHSFVVLNISAKYVPAISGVKLKPVAIRLPPVAVLYQRISDAELTPALLTLNSGKASPVQISMSVSLAFCGAAICGQLQSGA